MAPTSAASATNQALPSGSSANPHRQGSLQYAAAPGLLLFLPAGGASGALLLTKTPLTQTPPVTITSASIPPPPIPSPPLVRPDRPTTPYDDSSTRLRESSRGRHRRVWPKTP